MPTRQGQLNLIRAKCVEANPDIGDNIVGCVCGHDWTHHDVSPDFAAYRFRDYRKSCDYCLCKKYRDKEYRPIRLADVLWGVIGKTNTANRADVVFEIVDRWNLRKDNLTEQSDECVAFLAELLDN